MWSGLVSNYRFPHKHNDDPRVTGCRCQVCRHHMGFIPEFDPVIKVRNWSPPDAFNSHFAQVNEAPPGKRTLCGPIVGRVTPYTARILIEVEFSATISVEAIGTNLNPDICSEDPEDTSPDEHQVVMKVALTAKQPAIIHLKRLKPAHSYSVDMSATNPFVGSLSFRTPPVTTSLESKPLSLAFIAGTSSEQHPEVLTTVEGADVVLQRRRAQGEAVLFNKGLYWMAMDRHVDVVVHSGNSLRLVDKHETATSHFSQALNLAKRAYSPDAAFTSCVKFFQTVYRSYLSEPSLSGLLANCSNIFLLGEFDLGRVEVDVCEQNLPSGDSNQEAPPLPPSTPMIDNAAQIVVLAAFEVYNRYAYSLWFPYKRQTTIAGALEARRDSHCTAYMLGPVALVSLDILARSTLYPEDPYLQHPGTELLGEQQWSEFRSKLAELRGVDMLLVHTQQPLVGQTSLFSNEYVDELEAVLDTVRDWVQCEPTGAREALLMATSRRRMDVGPRDFIRQGEHPAYNPTIRQITLGCVDDLDDATTAKAPPKRGIIGRWKHSRQKTNQPSDRPCAVLVHAAKEICEVPHDMRVGKRITHEVPRFGPGSTLSLCSGLYPKTTYWSVPYTTRSRPAYQCIIRPRGRKETDFNFVGEKGPHFILPNPTAESVTCIHRQQMEDNVKAVRLASKHQLVYIQDGLLIQEEKRSIKSKTMSCNVKC
ncbi:MAG: uncharacterized protein KVP18_000554 [Porospora cf. gigantea A]|uniref:uncharacterized protein n=1 Tax=Porospora cf. gigantea A TaxID=2853593 RepID=UPI00355A80AE|nr:MAG: hypothetical protein KVP18_000554 [Porospora cf. gigantea A]